MLFIFKICEFYKKRVIVSYFKSSSLVKNSSILIFSRPKSIKYFHQIILYMYIFTKYLIYAVILIEFPMKSFLFLSNKQMIASLPMMSFSDTFSVFGIGMPFPCSNFTSSIKLAGIFFKFDYIYKFY